MGLESIPWLTAIVTGIVSLGKTIWDVASRNAARMFFWFATVVPMLLRWFVKHRLFALALLVALAAFFSSLYRQIAAFAGHTLQMSDRAQWFFNHFRFMTFILWDGPLRLRYAFGKFPDILSLFTSILALKWLFVKAHWVLIVYKARFSGR